jgi:hypothetical protein
MTSRVVGIGRHGSAECRDLGEKLLHVPTRALKAPGTRGAGRAGLFDLDDVRLMSLEPFQ